MNFEDALKELRNQGVAKRAIWPSNWFIKLDGEDEYFILLFVDDDKDNIYHVTPWKITQKDILADDWIINCTIIESDD